MQGFDFSRVGRLAAAEAAAARAARVLPVPSFAVVTSSSLLQRFDLCTMNSGDVEFHAEFCLRPQHAGGAAAPASCVGLVVWFDTEFSARFCKEAPVVLSTSPDAPPTHWAQTLFDFKVR